MLTHVSLRRVACLLVGLCLCMTVVAQASSRRRTPLVQAVEQIADSVVNIHSEKSADRRETVFSSGRDRKVSGMGTGIVIDERGYIVTNYHVVHEVDALRVTLHDGSTYGARVVSFDRSKDLAIIHINTSHPLTVMPITTSTEVMLAETVFAVGNAFGYEHTVTSGIVSHLSRDVEVNEEQSYENLIQTDASINPGNSGGPLLNLDGDLVAINVAIRAGAQRIGFAIPIDDARRVIAKLLNCEQLGGVTHGIRTRDVKAGDRMQLLVESADPGSPAQQAGLRSGDVIVGARSYDVLDRVDLERSLLGLSAGEAVAIDFERQGERQQTRLTLTSYRGRPRIAARPVKHSTTPQRTAARTNASGSANTTDDRAWQAFGFRLAVISSSQVQNFAPKYRGGMRVVAVRPGSSADRNGIHANDILLGLQGWETISFDNLEYVLDQQKPTSEKMLFYVLRDGKLMWGHIQAGE